MGDFNLNLLNYELHLGTDDYACQKCMRNRQYAICIIQRLFK